MLRIRSDNGVDTIQVSTDLLNSILFKTKVEEILENVTTWEGTR
ncbi:hypothetical protein SNEBB_001914, partial [Seison nebaliae]